MWYLPDRYKIGPPGIPQSTFNFDAHVMRLLPLLLYTLEESGGRYSFDYGFGLKQARFAVVWSD